MTKPRVWHFSTMRKSLLIGSFLITAIALAVVVAILSSFYTSIETSLAKVELTESSNKATDQLKLLVSRTNSVTRASRDWAASGLYSLDDIESHRKIFVPLITHGPHITSVVTADETGREVLFLHAGGDKWMARVSNPHTMPKKSLFYTWKGSKLVSKELKVTDYDAKVRPWFRLAQTITDDSQILWTDPFVFKSTRELGIAVVTSWSKNGLRHYVASDLRLIDLSRHTAAIVPGKNGFAAIFTDEGKLIGLPSIAHLTTDEEITKNLLKDPKELNIPALADGYAVWQSRGANRDEMTPFTVGKENWLAVFRTFKVGDKEWTIGTFAPEADFISPLSGYLALFFGLLGLTLVLTWFFATLLANKFTKPVKELIDASAAIGRLELDQPVSVRSNWREIKDLVQAQDAMREKLLVSTQELREMNEALEDKVTERTQKLEQSEAEARQMVKKLEMADRARLDFLAKVSHEIRTPMNVVTGFSYLGQSAPKEKQHEFLKKISDAASRISVIIDDLLDISRMEIGKLKISNQPFDLSDTLNYVEKILSFKAQEKDLEFEIDPPAIAVPMLVGDPLRLGQILLNLLGNAIKFTNKGKVSLKIAVADADTKNAVLKFVVEDTGVGISSDGLRHLFGEYTHLDEPGITNQRGAGLGLAISKQLIERMDGTIHVESTVGVGSRFSFQIPFKVHDPSEASQTKAKSHDLHNARVLIVDDQETNLTIAYEILRHAGCKAETTTSGKDALSILKERGADFDIVLMDLQMPELDGYETARRIREELKNERVAIIAMSAYTSAEDRSRCAVAGMNDFAAKPVEPRSFISTVGKWAEKVRTLDKLITFDTRDFVVSRAYMRANWNQDLLFRMIKNFPEKVSSARVQPLRDAIQSRDEETASHLAHSLAGTAANIGALRIHACAHAIEKGLRTKTGSDFEINLKSLEDAIQSFHESEYRTLIKWVP